MQFGSLPFAEQVKYGKALATSQQALEVQLYGLKVLQHVVRPAQTALCVGALLRS